MTDNTQISSEEGQPGPRIGVILAGGQSRRMGADKATEKLAGRRLIDHVIERLAPQVDRILIAGPRDYGTGLAFTADRADGPRGPAAGLWAAAHWVAEHAPDAADFVTAPVDGPFLPPDFYEKLSAGKACAIASNAEGDQPPFAFWRLSVLMAELGAAGTADKGLALIALAESCEARRVEFSPQHCLMNINSPEDLARVQELATKNC